MEEHSYTDVTADPQPTPAAQTNPFADWVKGLLEGVTAFATAAQPWLLGLAIIATVIWLVMIVRWFLSEVGYIVDGLDGTWFGFRAIAGVAFASWPLAPFIWSWPPIGACLYYLVLSLVVAFASFVVSEGTI